MTGGGDTMAANPEGGVVAGCGGGGSETGLGVT